MNKSSKLNRGPAPIQRSSTRRPPATIRAIFIIFIIILVFISVIAFKPELSLAKNTSDGYINSGAKILDKSVTIRLNGDYSYKVLVTESIKIITARGISKYSEVIIPFSVKYQSIKLLYGYTLLNGMYKVPIGKKAVNIVSPGFAVKYPSYSDIKYLTLSMPAVEPGSIINFSYEIDNFKPLIKKGAFLTSYISGEIPVEKIRYTLIYPRGMKINLYFHNIDASLINKNSSRISLYLRNIGALKKESNMPPLSNFEKSISFSTYVSWKALFANINEKFLGAEGINKRIEKFVEKAAGGSKNEKERVVRIYNDFVKRFRYVGIGYGINGYDPDPAAATFSNGYGDSKSLAALLIVMLEHAGIRAYPVLAASMATHDLNKGSVSPRQFDSVIVAVTINGETFYLYPDSSSYKAFSLPYTLSGREAAGILPDGSYRFITLPPQKPTRNEKVYEFSGKINKRGILSGKVKITYRGVYANYKRSLLKGQDKYKKMMSMYDFLYDFIPSADVYAYEYKNMKNINKRLILKVRLSDRNYGGAEGDKLVFHQVVPYDKGLLQFILKRKRTYPLVAGYPFTHISHIIIRVPDNSNIYYLPGKLDISNNTATAQAGCNFIENKGNLDCNFKFESRLSEVPAKDFENYKSIIEAYLNYLKNYFVVLSSMYFYHE